MIIPLPALEVSCWKLLPKKSVSICPILVMETMEGITFSTISDTSVTVVAVLTLVVDRLPLFIDDPEESRSVETAAVLSVPAVC